jgi:putative membrane protein
MRHVQKSLLAALCATLLHCATAAAQTPPEQVGNVTSQPGNRTAKDFAQAVIMSDKFAIVTGKLALERSRDPAIRDLASAMVAAHRQIEKDLKRVTDRFFVNRRITPPPLFDPPHTKRHRALLVSSGPTFDQLYIAQQIEVHQELMETLEGYANKGGLPQLQDFARKTIPVVRQHQEMLNNMRSMKPSTSDAVAAR